MTPIPSGLRVLVCSSALLLITACRAETPPCPVTDAGDRAPSAGCLALRGDQVLLVEYYNGKFSPPGGKAERDESAQCAAHRETWEETGLNLVPGPLLAVFETGFHIYGCEQQGHAGELNAPTTEVRRALWLPLTAMETVEWRFAGQGAHLRQLIDQRPQKQTGAQHVDER